MSQRRIIENKTRNLEEIRDILNAMKNMARMEVSRLSRFIEAQREMVATIESAAQDFATFHPGLFPRQAEGDEICVLLGSERGFCGDFNGLLVHSLESRTNKPAKVVALGAKLQTKMIKRYPDAVFLPGPGSADEVEQVMLTLMDEIRKIYVRDNSTTFQQITVFHHQPNEDEIQVSALRPFLEPPSARTFASPPILYLKPDSFASGLLETYLFAKLHQLLHSSLTAENQVRMNHLDTAVQRLERKTEELARRRNTLRQEEITEEIEVIMLGMEP